MIMEDLIESHKFHFSTIKKYFSGFCMTYQRTIGKTMRNYFEYNQNVAPSQNKSFKMYSNSLLYKTSNLKLVINHSVCTLMTRKDTYGYKL